MVGSLPKFCLEHSLGPKKKCSQLNWTFEAKSLKCNFVLPFLTEGRTGMVLSTLHRAWAIDEFLADFLQV